MRKFKRLTMTLALLIMAVGGAWAQSSPNVVEFKVPADWEANFDNLTAADLPGFSASSLAEAQAWTGAPAEGTAFLIYAFDGDKVYYVPFSDGKAGEGSQDSFIKYLIFGYSQIMKICYTATPAAIELTPDADKKVWTLAEMPAGNVELQVEYEPTKVTMAANDNTMGTVEVSGKNKVEWTADTWKNWTSSNKVCTVDDITVTSTESASVNEWTNEDKYLHSLFFYVSREDNNSTVTISTTGDPFSRIEFTMIDDYAEDKYIENKGWSGNPVITPKDNWTFEGKSAVWEGEATKSLTLQSCTTWVSKITFFKGAVPDGVTVNTDGTFTVAKTATVTLTATPAEGYKFLYWDDDQTNTNPVREVTIESGMADMTYKAVFAEPTFNVTFAEGTDLNEWNATPNTGLKQGDNVTVTYTGSKKVIGVKAEKKSAAVMTTVTWNSTNVFNSAHENVKLSKFYPTPLTYEGITISLSATKASSFKAYDEDDHKGLLTCYGNYDDSFTFTAPSGKKFCKIEIINNGSIVFTNYGDWTKDASNKIVWSGTAATAVTLGSVLTDADDLNSIVFYLSE